MSEENPVIKVDGSITVEVIAIDPALAKEMLEWNMRNRRPSPGHERQITRDMKKGDFEFIGDPIRFSADGELLDGQQRLGAVIESGLPVEFIVIRGLPERRRKKIDTGRRRSASDQLAIDQVPSATLKASIAKCLLQWDRRSLISGRFRPTVADISDFVDEESERFDRACSEVAKVRVEVQIPSGVLGAFYFKVSSLDENDAKLFFEALATGAGLEEGDPILVLRRTLFRRQRNGERNLKSYEQLYFLTSTWDKWRSGRTVDRIIFPRAGVKAEHIPMIIDCGRTTGEDDL